MSARLLTGFITAFNAYALNDFESMTVGPCTTLTGWTLTGGITVGSAFFISFPQA